MAQRTPHVTEQDAWRVLERDYGQHDVTQLRAAISNLDVREKWRVVLACLKSAGGSIDALRGNLESAGGYWRELISEAEYPRATKIWGRIDRLSPTEQEEVFEADWRQYDAWLHRKRSAER